MTAQEESSARQTGAKTRTIDSAQSSNPLDWRLRSVDHQKYIENKARPGALHRLIAGLFGQGKEVKTDESTRPEFEIHHSYNGRPWCLGLDHYHYLVSRGLSPKQKFLDIGCGALRTGVHIIDYLDSGNYVGIDAHQAAIDVALNYEVPMNRLENKSPRLLQEADFDLQRLEEKFDWVFAFAVVNHLDDETFDKAFKAFRDVLKPNAKLVLSPKPRVSLEKIRDDYGFCLVNEEVRNCKLTDSDIHWFEFSLLDS